MTEYMLTQEQILQGFRIEDDYLYDKAIEFLIRSL